MVLVLYNVFGVWGMGSAFITLGRFTVSVFSLEPRAYRLLFLLFGKCKFKVSYFEYFIYCYERAQTQSTCWAFLRHPASEEQSGSAGKARIIRKHKMCEHQQQCA